MLTRRTDVFIPLQERTVIANREGADLFVSIHVNASENRSARGVETYLLDFASTPDAAASGRARERLVNVMTMSNLNDLVKRIALKSKLGRIARPRPPRADRHGAQASALEPADLGISA